MGDLKKPDLHLDYAATLIDLAQYADDHPEVDMMKHMRILDEQLLNTLNGPEFDNFKSKTVMKPRLDFMHKMFSPSSDPKYLPYTSDAQIRAVLIKYRDSLEQLDHVNDPAHRYDIEKRMDAMHLDNDPATDYAKVADAITNNDDHLADLYLAMINKHKEIGVDKEKLTKGELSTFAINLVMVNKFIDQKRESNPTIAENYLKIDGLPATTIQNIKLDTTRAPGQPSSAPTLKR